MYASASGACWCCVCYLPGQPAMTDVNAVDSSHTQDKRQQIHIECAAAHYDHCNSVLPCFSSLHQPAQMHLTALQLCMDLPRPTVYKLLMLKLHSLWLLCLRGFELLSNVDCRTNPRGFLAEGGFACKLIVMHCLLLCDSLLLKLLPFVAAISCNHTEANVKRLNFNTICKS